uniref:Exocyst complex component Sec8 n=1 Tax=Panagrolaimus superbus TaxID=310955 RepID=A0A914YM52_9BILA
MPVSNEESSVSLVNVIRTLTTSQSLDQKQIEKTRLEAGFQKSAERVDQLLSSQQKDISNALKTFRAVSSEITSSRQRIHAVKNALAASKVLLQCRRDDLKKLWVENVEQKVVCNILQQIEEIQQMDLTFEEHLKAKSYKQAVKILKNADITLNGPLSGVEGLDQLRTHATDLTGTLFENVVVELIELLSTRPFESQMLELLKGMTVETINESVLCLHLTEKYKDVPLLNATLLPGNETPSIAPRLAECLESLAVFDQLLPALEQVFNRSKTVYSKAIADTVLLLKLLMKEPVADSSHLAKLIQMVMLQINKACEAHKVLAKELSKVGRYEKDINVELRFWDAVSEVLQTVVMKHLDIYDYESNTEDFTETTKMRQLFRFDGTNCVSSYSTRLTAQPIPTICKSDAYNIIPIFQFLNSIGHTIKEQCGLLKFNNFLHTVVMSTFIKRVSDDINAKVQTILSRADVWSALSSTTAHCVRLLTSCLSIYELCKHIMHLISNIEQYTLQFAQIWLKILSAYTESASDTYSNITKSRINGDDDTLIEHRKISAAWVADEDIKRMLKTFPQWSFMNQAGAQPLSFEGDITPTGRMGTSFNENDKEIKARTEKEAAILIQNLGKTKSINKSEVIFDQDNIKLLICMHESLQWFTVNVKLMQFEVPKEASNILKTTTFFNKTGSEQKLWDAFQQEFGHLEEMAETCLLMVHLELRVHCFYYLLPLSQLTSGQPQDDIDNGVVEFGRKMVQHHKLLSSHLFPTKVKYLFDGLGHLCASIFIHSSQHINKLTESNKKRMIRNIFGVQQHLRGITSSRENELDRAKTFFDLLNKDPDQLLALIMERGAVFTFQEYTYLLALAVRSDQNQSSVPGALDKKIAQLQVLFKQKS